MKVTSSSIVNGYFLDQHGKYGKEISIPFEIHDYPENTKSFAFLFEDKDAIPVCGFSFIHWVGYNLTTTNVESNASESNPPFNQGLHSCSHEMKEHYVGMAPPDADHRYELHVYALDTLLNLKEGVPFNEVYWAMENHILEQATCSAYYRV